jgi:hypothetical protein
MFALPLFCFVCDQWRWLLSPLQDVLGLLRCAPPDSQWNLNSTKWVAQESVGRAEKNLATVATPTQPNMNNAALANALLLIESCLQSLLLTDRNEAFQQAIEACLASMRTIYSHLTAALKAHPASLDAFKHSVLPLYKPSPLLQESVSSLDGV